MTIIIFVAQKLIKAIPPSLDIIFTHQVHPFKLQMVEQHTKLNLIN